MQQWDNSYWETYYPVINMISLQLILAITNIHKLSSKMIDFVLAFPQAILKEDIWMPLPVGLQVNGKTEEDSDRYYVLKLKKIIYGLKKASFNQYKTIKTALEARKFKASNIDPCLYMVNGMIVLKYFDDCIIVEPSMIRIDGVILSLKDGNENSVLTDDRDIKINIGIYITHIDEKISRYHIPF